MGHRPRKHQLLRDRRAGSGDVRPGKTNDSLSIPRKTLSLDASASGTDLCRHRRYVVPLICGLLVLAVAVIFAQTLNHDFVNFDDGTYVLENRPVAEGITVNGLSWAFTSFHATNWHPVTWLSHMLDCQLYDLEPWGHHLTNVLLHAANAVLLFLVLLRMTGNTWPSAFVAAVFAVHPLRVESVAWVSERKDILSGLFFMLTLWAYVAYARRPFSVVRYTSVILLFALGLMAKPMLVTLPFVLLLLDYWPLGRMTQPANRASSNTAKAPSGQRVSLGRLAVEKAPLFMLSAASCVATSLAQQSAIASADVIAIPSRVANAMVAYVTYLVQSCYPAGLAVLYPLDVNRLPAWEITAAVFILVGARRLRLCGDGDFRRCSLAGSGTLGCWCR